MTRDRGHRRATVYGFVVAVVGFLLTRMTVTLAAGEAFGQFLLTGLAPLVLGLSLSVFGVALAVGAFTPEFARTVAVWCVLGTGSMVVLAVLTLVGTTGELPTPTVFRSRELLSNFVIGGAIGGTVTGVYAAVQSQQERSLRERSNRLVLLNRLLRDDVINAMLAIDGYVDLLEQGRDVDDKLVEVFEAKSATIEATIDDVGHLSRAGDDADIYLEPTRVRSHVEGAVDTVRASHPEASYDCTFDVAPEETVWADDLLERVVTNLVDNAVRYSESATPHVAVSVSATSDLVSVSVTDDGPGLPPDQQSLLEAGDLSEYDDPTTGFGLNVVRLLAESYGAGLTTSVSPEGTTVTVELRRVTRSGPAVKTTLTDLRSYGVDPRKLSVAAGSAAVAGIVMGVVVQALAGVVPVIGALYGVANPLVGWITHLFHSLVFGLIYPALLTVVPGGEETPIRRVGVAVGWGLLLWLLAAGVIMPVWLRLVGLPAPLPNLTIGSLVGHLVWGLVLGGGYELARDTAPVKSTSHFEAGAD